MYIRSHSWGAANLSWSVVIEELLYAADKQGHDIVFVSTNGYKGMKYWNEERGLKQNLLQREILRSNKSFDLDMTYTVPQNFPDRFLSNSKCRVAIYNYESSIMPAHWNKYYSFVDYVLPSSKYVAEMFENNGCHKDKIVVVPHGIDLEVFNPSVKPAKIQTDKKFKFLCIAEPHYRKQLDKLLRLYAKTFTSADDVCLVLKTKIFDDNSIKEMKEFEMDLRPVLKELRSQYGAMLPEIKVISGRLNNIASLYTACDAFVLMTASEGWGMPYLEALACGVPVIAPRHGGQLEFLSDDNAILTKCGIRKARPQEQYWVPHPRAVVGSPDEADFSDQMINMYKNHAEIKARLLPAMLETASKLTWFNAMNQIIKLAETK
jgi:glycosyltransferase involved in cell wall biosynthesis